MPDTDSRLLSLESKYSEILGLLKELRKSVPENSLENINSHRIEITTGVKAIIKQGMSDFYSGKNNCPYADGDKKNEYWQLGFDNAKDTWDEIKK